MPHTPFEWKRIVPLLLLAALAGCSSDKKGDADAGTDAGEDAGTDTDDDAGTDADTDADTDTDTDTDTDADTDADAGPDPELDLDCSDAGPFPTELCDLGSNPCDEGSVCSELLWVDSPIYPNIVSNYCFPACGAPPVEPDAGLDAGEPFVECAGSNVECVEFDDGASGCVPLGQLKAEFEIVVAPPGEAPVPTDFPWAESFGCAAPVGFGDPIAVAVGDALDGGLEDGGTAYDVESVVVVWVRPKGFAGTEAFQLNVTIPVDNWLDGEVLDLDAEPEAFWAFLLYVQYEGPFSSTYSNAWIEAVATSGTIEIEYAADPCSGAGCEPATGTMDLWFELRRAELDPSTVPPI